uniref:Cysteine-rich motor neuron 1 protein n=1 Tax=Lepeophtheirus salmonis TaxID=72036 RepID=D3PHT4_LEPSM|nr:Cysteine-rich motor neuron 1 protein [Lepeophtheirus salmonis]
MDFLKSIFGFIFLMLPLISMAQVPCNMNEKCLKVFDHEPRTWPKCYCTSLCQESLNQLNFNCSSGQALWDNCGICLRCAKARGERCGGPHNVDGMCASGLACLIKVDPSLPPKESIEEEQRSFGLCVDETSDDCPKTGSSQAARERTLGVNCRPGRIGILLEALYCPDLGACIAPTPAPFPTKPSLTSESPNSSSSLKSPSFATHDSKRTRPTRRRKTRPSHTPSLSFITLLLSSGE